MSTSLSWPMPPVLRAMKRQGYAVFAGPYNINVWGIRMGVQDPEHLPEIDDQWNDYIGASYQDSRGVWHEVITHGTTDPGRGVVLRSIHSRGTAVLKPGQYLGAYQVGTHNDREALVHWGTSPMEWWRVDKTGKRVVGADGKPLVERGWTGINLHNVVGEPPPLVGPWSAGCQVIPDKQDYARLLQAVKTSTLAYGPYVTYTLLVEGQVWPKPRAESNPGNAPRTFHDLLPNPRED